MSIERTLAKKEQKIFLEDAHVSKVGENYSYLREKLSDHYFRAWNPLGLCESQEVAQRRLDNYHQSGIFETSFITSQPQKEKIYSLLLTTNIRGDSLLDVLEKVPQYSSFEFPITKKDRGRLGFNICFSITSEEGFGVKNKKGEDVSLARFTLFESQVTPGYFRFAYSRLHGVGRKSALRFYIQNVTDTSALGATGMHEGAFGGATLAIIKDSRPEDTLGGKANTFILLPNDNTQREINQEIMGRRKEGFVPYEKIGPFMLFTDAWPYLSLAR